MASPVWVTVRSALLVGVVTATDGCVLADVEPGTGSKE